jgi:predicted dehydrogenase
VDSIGIGFIGSGFAADLHAHALGRIRGSKCEIVAVCSRTRESVEAFAGERLAVPQPGRGLDARLSAGDAGLRGRRPRGARAPVGALLAHETVEVIYAAYVSAQEGRRVDLKR